MEKIESFLLKNNIDLNARVDCPNGGMYLKNLLKEFKEDVRDETIVEIVKEVRSKASGKFKIK